MKACESCTYQNPASLLQCEICQAPLPTDCDEEAALGAQKTGAVSLEDFCEGGEGIKCSRCTFLNNPMALMCSVCNHIFPPATVSDSNEIGNQAYKENWGSNVAGGPATANIGAPAFYGNQATDGLIELLRNCLGQTRSSWSLCSPCTHFNQMNVVGAEWACGFRNIQMLCHSLVQSPIYRKLLFTGNGDIPDVHGIQSWIEKAWSEGFDIVGAADFPGGILGTDKWVGASECAAMLRNFGLRAHVVDFMDEDYASALMNGQVAITQGMQVAAYICDICDTRIQGHRFRCSVRENYDLCEACEIRHEQPFPMNKIPTQSASTSSSSSSYRQHNKDSAFSQGHAQAYNGGGRLAFVPLSNHVTATSSSGRRTTAPKSYSDFAGVSEAELGAGDGSDDESSSSGSKRKRDEFFIEHDGGEETEASWPIQWTEAAASSAQGQGQGRGLKRNRTSKNSQALAHWIERYFNNFQLSVTDARSPSHIVHPIYLQHDGHSRTVVGIQKEEKKTNLLLFDPQVKGTTLRHTLEQGNGWQKHLKRQLTTFDSHRHLQIVYVSGVMTREEREKSKTIMTKDPEESLMSTIRTLVP